ncbi:MAG TPA: cobalt chelatase [Porphyromonadaceae bacterium]|jgi:sirohydrochlorin cobaltochelatase|nr:cobalt chelatase [Porphyromonadaceae bacterium]HBL33016.1 cobalt chelatase [Porphyromonadaceae bacterium]HBX21321.1 cobalt chelatase [Porphyromonadaceae bacterium]
MNKFLKFCFSLTLILSAGFITSCGEDDPAPYGDRDAVSITKKNPTALLLCSFGSTYEQPQATYDKIIKDYQEAYPNTDIYMSFTSRTIVSRVYAQIGKAYAQPDLWLEAIGKAGYQTVYVQSLHIIPGEEYLSLMNTDVKKNFMIPYADVKVAKSPCLLETEEDVDKVAKILYDFYKERLTKGEVVALMGHGNPDREYNHANLRYEQLEEALQKLSGEKNIFVGTVDWGDQMFTHIREELVAYAERKNKTPQEVTVNLSPLMSIAGDHAQNDLLGGLEDGQTLDKVNPEEPDHDAQYSWKLKLEKLGFTISPEGATTDPAKFNVIGLGDHKAIRAIWLDHMKKAVKDATSWHEHLGD